ncbi:hypothetical protein E2C01_004503 [Portunus trituberculatus]|uniref:Uncharacterized protein n=1 Tax=Portunus trituberculatus TaxID=210409 RepID=A0A5B7CQP9_PORTR|nr:hypothetical protein [Portunus trituberculatus]
MPARSLLPLPHGRAGKVRAYVRFFIYTLQGRANAWPEVRRQAQRSCRLWSEPPRLRPGLPNTASHWNNPWGRLQHPPRSLGVCPSVNASASSHITGRHPRSLSGTRYGRQSDLGGGRHVVAQA